MVIKTINNKKGIKMIEQKKVGNNHVIYGYWNAEEDNEFMVYYHPDGINCTVFMMMGMDYGGGISYYFDCSKSSIDNIIANSKNKSAYEIKDLVSELPEAIEARKRH